MKKKLLIKLVRDCHATILQKSVIVLLLIFPCYTGFLQAQSNVDEIYLTIDIQNKPMTEALDMIAAKSDCKFFFQDQLIEPSKRVNLKVTNGTLRQTLDKLFAGTGNTYAIDGKQVFVQKRPSANQGGGITVTGVVTDEKGEPLPGANIRVQGTLTGISADARGAYSLVVMDGSAMLEISFIGYETKSVALSDARSVKLKANYTEIENVVVTGIFTRKAESYTGSSVTMTSKDLTRVGSQNVFQSLKNLDASLQIFDNIDFGSNPNVMPEMRMRGVTSFPADKNAVSIKGNYQNVPNQPLFIVDGFEAGIERVFDMDMNRIESVTYLKDASAKALYGSKAANGIVVIETKRLSRGEQRITYIGGLEISMPDLTSYNLCNAAEKLEVERIEGVYLNGADPIKLYNDRKKLILEGLDTYWISKPLRVGVGQRHSLSVELGDYESLRGALDFNYNNVEGVMKGSGRTNIQGNLNLSYRRNKILFRNIMTITSNKSSDSPFGSFNDYVKMNPYWRATDYKTGATLRWADDGNYIPNPMYDAEIGTFSTQSYLEFVNNFEVEYRFTDYLKVVGRVGVSSKRNSADEFLPANHSIYSTYEYLNPSTSDETKARRGSYRLDNGMGSTLKGDINAQYSRNIGKSSVFVNIGSKVEETSFSGYINKAEGFPNNQAADITFARQYASGTRPIGISSLIREISFLGTGNYTYDNRYFVDLTYRMSASSLYGNKKRWAPGWSAGFGWNIHNESFLKDSEIIRQLRLRLTTGVLGNQSFNVNEAIGTYQYFTELNYQGQTGAYLSKMPNPALKWEQTREYNAGLDITVHRAALSIDYYDRRTENMINDITKPTSIGFNGVKENLGLVGNKGFELKLSYNIFMNENGFFNVNGSVAHNVNKIIRLSESMRTTNEIQEKAAADQGNNRPVLLYRDGQSMTTIWAVKSLGIDPMTGQEVYVKKDGTLTYAYDSNDLIAAGDLTPKYYGTFGFSAEYKGFGLNSNFRFTRGGQKYNQTLVDRVENIDIQYNVDRRVLLGRWQTPGQNAQFKRLGTFQYQDDPVAYNEVTRATTRFVQTENLITWGSLSVYYDFQNNFLERTGLKRLKLSFIMNDVLTISSIKAERGLYYPFARVMSFGVTGTF